MSESAVSSVISVFISTSGYSGAEIAAEINTKVRQFGWDGMDDDAEDRRGKE